MKIGFTGTRNGMTDAQAAGIIFLIDNIAEFHHGSCKGADVQAARLIHTSFDDVLIVCHPGPDNDPCREQSGYDCETRVGKNHFARNRDIVNECDLLIGCPGAMEWQTCGGTFYTMDYAIKQKKPVKVIWPDGRIENR